ncbi:MAG TPA: M14 family metallopeptidase [Longimicrobium sp.]|nr:M14 family metallopeptidase [Longimicrobium sp.]
MRRHTAALLSLALALAVAGAHAQTGIPRTRPERTDHRETSRYDEVVAFMEAADRASPLIHLTTFGYTLEGRTLPLAVVGRVADASPAAVRASGRTVVYLQGNIHAGEVEGKESLQMLLRDVAGGKHAAWLDSLVLLIAPIYNADGNERVLLTNRAAQHGPVGGMGQRPNAQGLDLNRDHTKLESPEARSLAWLLREYDPHVLVDLHTTNGTYHAYHLTYAAPLHPNTPDAITRELRGAWLPAVTRAMRERGWLAYYYGNVPSPQDGNADAERAWYTFDHRPRFGTNYAGLRNRFAILSEAYSYLTFADRIRVTSDFVEEVLDYAAAHASSIRRATAAADAESVVGRAMAVTARLRRTPAVEILMGEVEEQRHPYTGQPMLLRRDVVRPERMPEFQQFDAADTETAPRAYLVLPDAGDVLDRLRAHGVRMSTVMLPREVRVEEFRVDTTWTAERAFQGHRERTVRGAWQPSTRAAPAGSVLVPLDQPLGRLVFTLLEPRSDDGFTAWNVLDPWIERGTYPILRMRATPQP